MSDHCTYASDHCADACLNATAGARAAVQQNDNVDNMHAATSATADGGKGDTTVVGTRADGAGTAAVRSPFEEFIQVMGPPRGSKGVHQRLAVEIRLR